jgi:hypothetical protein
MLTKILNSKPLPLLDAFHYAKCTVSSNAKTCEQDRAIAPKIH